ncbi:hypothetical protein ACWCOP_02405 [Maricaulaceae bacterium MS644]
MARDGASPKGAETAAGLAVRALHATAERRAGADHPALYDARDNPWTDQIARELRGAVADSLEPDHARCHAVAARWRFPSMLKDGPVMAAAHPLYDIAWRIYAEDGSALIAQPLIAECPWRGGWRALSGAADRLAQGRADVKLLCAMDDPARAVGEMTLAEACAFRINAFAPPGDDLMLAFYGRAESWRETAGFSIFTYVTGRDRIEAVNPQG